VIVRDLYADGATEPARIRSRVNDSYLRELATAITGRLGGQVGIAPRVFLKKLVVDVLDRVDQFSDFDPRKNYALTLAPTELTEIERNAATTGTVAPTRQPIAAPLTANDIDLDL
jgi:hypothetical protein